MQKTNENVEKKQNVIQSRTKKLKKANPQMTLVIEDQLF